MRDRGVFFLLAGPTAAGKTAVLKRLLETSAGLVKNISVTTRAPRTGEVDGRDYRFWDRERFERENQAGAFLEHATVHGLDYYGTLKQDVLDRLDAGEDVIKDIDVQGVEQVRAVMPYPQSVAIFLVPPSRKELVDRFQRRGTESEDAFQRRLRTAESELRRIGEYDYLVVNAVVEQAAGDLAAIRAAERFGDQAARQMADGLKRARREQEFRQAWGV